MLLSVSELLVRLTGLLDFPIYLTNDYLGYIPMPNQSGKFLNKNAWFFNDRSMAISKNYNSKDKLNLLLIGNSIVMGGNPYNQPDKLGSLIQKQIGDTINVWPIAAGGWTNVNEVGYLTHNMDIVKTNSFFVWQVMKGGFNSLSPARSEYIFPTKKPIIASWYFLRRYVLPNFIKFSDNELPPTGESKREYLDAFKSLAIEMARINHKTHSGILFFYPRKKEYIDFKNGTDYIADRKELEGLSKNFGIMIVDIAKSPKWGICYYKDDTHPTIEGNKVLSNILCLEIKKNIYASSNEKVLNN
jgi:hypothetical protein